MKKLVFLLLGCTSLWAAEFKAGVGRMVITPDLPIWLSGYAARTNPATGILHDLWAKALALEDDRQHRVVIVTTDLIGLPRQISDAVAAQVQKQCGLDRSQLLFNSSHTHSGPAVLPNLSVMFDFNPDDQERCLRYSQKLTEALVAVAHTAISNLAPARLSIGHGSAHFAINRRESTSKGMRIGLNPGGPTDPDVPVLKVTTPAGQLKAILFGYACHNTTLGADLYNVNGDYAGFAQLELEKAHPGTTALFMILCGADQNPSPRGKVELAAQYGKSLAEAVDRVLAGESRNINPPIRTDFKAIQLDLAAHDRSTFEKEAQNPDRFRRRRAKLMLKSYDEGHPIRQITYPVQTLRLSTDFTLVALGGEVVVDYALRLKREYPRKNLIVAGYCNDVMCYIPSQRVLREGGYEVVDSMIYYGQPGPFQETIEDTIIQAVRDLLKD